MKSSIVTRFFFAVVLLGLMTAWTFVSAHAVGEDWLTGYVPRFRSSHADSAAWLGYAGPARRILSLHGAWQAREIPSATNHDVTVPGAYAFQGEINFTRTFELDSAMNGLHLSLVALGISNRCRIYLNNEFLESHAGGHVPFHVNLPAGILHFEGPNEISITVDSRLAPRNTLPLQHDPELPASVGGIHRDIFIVAKPRLSIQEVMLQVESISQPSPRTMLVSCKIAQFGVHELADETANSLTVTAQVLDSERNSPLTRTARTEVTRAGENITAQLNVPLQNVQRWSPAKPALYHLKLTLLEGRRVIDHQVLTFGLSRMGVDERGFLVNDEHIRLQGIDYYDNGLGAPVDWNKDVESIKAMGANAVRVAGYPPAPQFLASCDREGLLVFIEIPLSIVPGTILQNDDFADLVRQYLEELYAMTRLHPSAAAIGLGIDFDNEHGAAAEFLAKMRSISTRPNPLPVYLVQSKLPQGRLAASVDFIMLHDSDASLSDLENVEPPPGPRFLSVGVPLRDLPLPASSREPQASQPGHGGHWDVPVAVQELQAYEITKILSLLQEKGRSHGVFINSLTDWRATHNSTVFGWQKAGAWNLTGMLNLDRSPRLVRDAVAASFRQAQAKRVAVNLFEPEAPVAYPLVGISLILVFLFIYNRDRRLSGNLRRIFFYSHGFFAELRDNRKVSNWHTFFLSFIISVILGVLSSAIAFYLRSNRSVSDLFDLVFGAEWVKELFIRLSWEPALSIPFFSLFWYLWFIGLILLLKISSVILGRRLRLHQFHTLVFWTGANFLWLLPIIPIYHRLLEHADWFSVAMLLVLLFVVWFCLRLLKGLKLLVNLSLLRTGTLAIILVVLIVGGLAFHLQEEKAFFDYVPMYWRVFNASW